MASLPQKYSGSIIYKIGPLFFSIIICAVNCYSQVITRRDESACKFERIQLEELNGKRDYSKMITVLERMIVTCPDRERSLITLSEAYMLTGQIDSGFKTIDKLLSIAPGNVKALIIQSKLFYLTGKDKEAEEVLLKAIGIESKNADLHYLLGRLYFQITRRLEAIDQFKTTISIDKGHYKAYDYLGLCYQAEANDQMAIAHYLKAIELVYKDHPEYDLVYANLADLMINSGEYKKAFDLAVEASDKNPSEPRNFFLTGKALYKLEKYDIAVRWLKRATELDADYAEPHYLLAQSYRKLNLNSDADREFEIFQKIKSKPVKSGR